MIVIASPTTAQMEVERLHKQSTPIVKTNLEPSYIKYLSAIDGAIYLDTSAFCYAIGVILDGVAKKDVGNAGRGARFNSALRYLHYLKHLDQEKVCIIVIISEDGLVDLIPEPVTEKTVRQLVRAFADEILEGTTTDESVREYTLELEKAAKTIEIDHEYYFLPADAWYEKEEYNRALEYYEKGMDLTEQLCIKARRKWVISLLRCYYQLEEFKRGESEILNKLLSNAEFVIIHGKEELKSNDYNLYAVALSLKLRHLKEIDENKVVYKKALDAFYQAIEMKRNRNKSVIYSNRALLYRFMNENEEALKDFIAAEVEDSKVELHEVIIELSGKTPELFIEAYKTYSSLMGEGWEQSELGTKIMDMYDDKFKNSPEIAVTIQEISSE